MIAIKINGEFVDANENLSVTLQQGVEEPSNISSRTFKHSYTISIENNSINRKTFNYFDNKKTGNFNQVAKNSIEIYSDGTKIFDGSAIVTEISADEIKFFCISDDASWIQDIQGNLKDLDFGTGYTFYGARANGSGYPSNAIFMKDFWSGNTAQEITTNEIIQFPLISYGNFYIGQWNITRYDLGSGSLFTADRSLDFINNGSALVYVNLRSGINSNIDDNIFQLFRVNSTQFQLRKNGVPLILTNGIITTFSNVGTMNFLESTEYFDVGQSPLESERKYSLIHELEFEDIPPCFNLKKTFDNVFNTSGWKINSSFMNSNLFQNLYMTYSGKKDPEWNWGTLSYVEIGDSVTRTLDKDNITAYSKEFSLTGGTERHIIDYIDASETKDYASIYGTVDGYVAPKNGLYNIYVEITGNTYLTYFSGATRSPANIIYLAKRSNKFGINSFENESNVGVVNVLISPTNITANLNSNDDIIFYVDTNWVNSGGPQNTVFPYSIITSLNDNFGYSDSTSIISRSLRTTSSQSISLNPIAEVIYEYNFSVDLNVRLTKGERLKFSNSLGNETMSVSSFTETNEFYSTIRLIENEDGTEPEEFLRPEMSMPEMSKIDFVKSIVNSFNLYSVTDIKNKTVLFEPRTEFILPSQFSLDWRDKEYLIVNYSPLNLSKFYTFSWIKDSNDIWTRQNEIVNGEQRWSKYGDGTFYKNVDQIYSEGEFLVSPQKIGFCAEREYHSNVTGSTTGLRIPTMMRKDDEFVPQRNVSWSFDHPPKIVEWQGMNYGAFILDEELQSQYPYAASTNTSGLTLTWYDKNIYSGNTQISNTPGMYSTFYKDQINEYINSEMTEITFIISTKDYLELDTRKQIFWNECHYRVIDIQYQPSQKLAKLKMIKTNI